MSLTTITILFLLSAFANSATMMSRNMYACPESTSIDNQTLTGAGIVVELTLLRRTGTRLELQVEVNNTGEKPVLIVSDPVTLDGEERPYLSVNESKPSQLEVAFAVYPPPSYTRLAPKNRVTFRRLGPGGSTQTNVVLQTPLTETKPPWGETFDSHTIDLALIQEIKINVGVLPDDAGVNDAFSRVRSSEGFELVKTGPFKGKLLFELQTLVSSKLLKL